MSEIETAVRGNDPASKLAWVKLWDTIESHEKISAWHHGELCEWGPNTGICLLSWLLP